MSKQAKHGAGFFGRPNKAERLAILNSRLLDTLVPGERHEYYGLSFSDISTEGNRRVLQMDATMRLRLYIRLLEGPRAEARQARGVTDDKVTRLIWNVRIKD